MNELDATLEALWAEHSVPAIGAALRWNGSLVWSGAVGVADREANIPLQPGGRVPIYSLTKTFTAVVMLGLAREGKLTLHEPLLRWFPELPLPETLTLTHLLKHTSGLKDYFASLPAYQEDVCHTPSVPWNDQKFLDGVMPHGLLFQPGEGWAYSNIGYLFLRLIIEQSTGQSFAECLAQRIFAPLGLKDTFVAEEITDWQSCIPGYGFEVSPRGETVDIRQCYHPGWCAPGVAVSTAEDTTLFYDRLLEGKIIEEQDLALMCDMIPVPGNHPPAVLPSCGMGLLGDPKGPYGPSFGHGGGGPGYSIWASTLLRPAGRLSIMVFCNDSQYYSEPMQMALLKTACSIYG